MTGLHPDMAVAKEWAWFYRSRGLNPLPASRSRKLPAIAKKLGGPGYARFWLDTFPASAWLESRARNIQIPCGVRWGLAVIDLDGPEAIATWESLCLFRDNPPTWTVRSGSGIGLHLWYVIPDEVSELPKRLLGGIWDDSIGPKGDWVRESRVELLGDRTLAMAPPSIHVETGRRYAFLPGRSPSDLPRPAVLPAWVLNLPPCQKPGPVLPPSQVENPWTRRPSFPLGSLPSGLRYRLDDVDDAVRLYRLPIVRGWGLRIVSERINQRGFVPCRAIGREDRNPSASFDPYRGYYSEANGPCYPFFLLGQVLGAYPDWRACVNDLGDHFGVRERATMEKQV